MGDHAHVARAATSQSHAIVVTCFVVSDQMRIKCVRPGRSKACALYLNWSILSPPEARSGRSGGDLLDTSLWWTASLEDEGEERQGPAVQPPCVGPSSDTRHPVADRISRGGCAKLADRAACTRGKCGARREPPGTQMGMLGAARGDDAAVKRSKAARGEHMHAGTVCGTRHFPRLVPGMHASGPPGPPKLPHCPHLCAPPTPVPGPPRPPAARKRHPAPLQRCQAIEPCGLRGGHPLVCAPCRLSRVLDRLV